MKVRYTLQAMSDLSAIATYFETQNPFVLPKIKSDIDSKIALIKQYPDAGRDQNDKTVKKAITRRYRYIIHYRIMYEQNEIQIITVRHFRQDRKYEDN
jgi:plasmid stabilization system protein ParE